MVVQVAVERKDTIELKRTDAFTVRVDSHRILTVVTYDASVVTKWLKQVLKSPNTKNGAVLVGFKAESDYTGTNEYPYQLLNLNIGFHTLIYHLPFTWHSIEVTPRSLIAFFQDPRVFAVGHDMATVAPRFKAQNQIEIRNAVDLNQLAVKGMKRDDLDLGQYDLGRLTTAVLGKEMDVVWPEKEVEWFGRFGYDSCQFGGELSGEKVKFSTVDSYLCFLIGSELIDAIDFAAAGLKKKKKKGKKKNK